MSSRSFTVFKDAASPVRTSKPRPLGRAASAAAILTSSRLSENSSSAATLPTSSTSSEKENTHPVTGLGARPPLGKKRKTSESGSGGVLATKMIAVAASASGDAKATGKSKPKAPLQPRADLKRKALSDAGSDKTKLKREGSKDGSLRTSGTSTASNKRTRSTSKLLLETIKEEEVVTKEKEEPKKQELIEQVLINSKCRDLTVSPLADVTDAYTQSTEGVDAKKDEEETESVAPSEVSLLFSSMSV